MRRLAALGGGLLTAALVFSSCTSGGGSGNAVPAPHPKFNVQLAFMQDMVQDDPAAGKMKLANVVGLGVTMCDQLLNGSSVTQVAEAMQKARVPVALGSALLVEATHYFCPSQTAKVKKEAGAG